MNSLSWLIYFAGFVEGLSAVFVFLVSIFLVATIVALIIAAVHLDETDFRSIPYEGQKLEEHRKTRKKFANAAGIFFSLSVFFMLFNSVIPSRQTVLLIAASEIGEQVATHQRVMDVIDPSVTLLQTWIRQQTQTIQQEMQRTQR